MQQPLSPATPSYAAPRFYLTGRQTLRPGAVLLATVLAVAALSGVLLALRHNRSALMDSKDGVGRSGDTSSGKADDKDDPNQVDTIVLGDPADAPVPARKGNHVSSVHPTILVRLPRFGQETGLIPNSAAGHLLYDWLAAFNKPSDEALRGILPVASVAMQMELRQQTGGFNLLSAKEVQPGVVVFRMRDQTPEAHEVLGTLQMVADSNPAAIASFSLRAVPSPRRDVETPK